MKEAINVIESVRLGAGMVLDMETSEIEGFLQVNNGGACWAVLYDPLPGGSGFLPEILSYWPAMCERAVEVLNACACEVACHRCMLLFRNQQHHGQLDRRLAAELMTALACAPVKEHDIPAISLKAPTDTTATESTAEELFQVLLEARNFPLPLTAQYRMELGAGFTIADFAYPDQKVLVLIDGMAAGIHGNPEQQRKDRIKRTQAKM